MGRASIPTTTPGHVGRGAGRRRVRSTPRHRNRRRRPAPRCNLPSGVPRADPKGIPLVAKDPAARAMLARAAAHERWAQVEDRTAATAVARQAALDRFERQVDPDGKLTPEERARRASNARTAHFVRMAYASAKSRRRAAGTPESVRHCGGVAS